MVGGFLGAGKTTLLGRLARRFQDQLLRVGLITNDQANNLVDTHTFRNQGFATEEIPGGCFCCRFNSLAEAAGKLTLSERPDVLLAEPVGSCTDLVATVVQPLKRLYGNQYVVAPYIVLADPARLRRILTGDQRGGFSPKVAYIFNKQLEEADAVAVNKADLLSADEREALDRLLRQRHPQKRTLFISARTGDGLDALLAFIEQGERAGQCIPEVDYDLYAEGEAELGWLNATVQLSSVHPFAADDVVLALAQAMHRALTQEDSEVAHLKLLMQAAGRAAIANLTRGDDAPELSVRSGILATGAELLINARVHADPERLAARVLQGLKEVCEERGLRHAVDMNQHFRPGRPVPTHRYAEAV
jgi:G3E family GTPase